MTVHRGKTATISSTVDEETRRILTEEAERVYGAKETKRRAALDWLLLGAEPLSAEIRDALLAEIDGPTKLVASNKRSRRTA